MESSSILSCLLNRDHNIEDVRIAHEWFKRKTDIFKDTSLETMKDTLEEAKIVEKYPNEIIIRQGDIGDSFYVLLSGSASIYINSDFLFNTKDEQQEQSALFSPTKLIRSARSGNVQKMKLESKKAVKEGDRRIFGEHIGKYNEGSCFGELALIQIENIRNASIIAEEKCHLLLISRELFDKVIRLNAESIYKEKVNFVNSHFLFQKWQPKLKHQVAMSLKKNTVYFGQDITIQGQPCNGLILIQKGTAKIVIDLKQHYTQYTSYLAQMEKEDVQFQDGNTSSREEFKSSRHMKENMTKLKRDKIEIAIIGKNDIIGDIEFGFTFPTNLVTVTASESCDIYLLETVHFERMINIKKNIGTYEILQDLAELKLNAYYKRCSTFEELPLLKSLLDEINEDSDMGNLTEKVEKQTPKCNLLPIFKTGPIIDFYGPGSVFFRNRLKRKINKGRMIKIAQSEKSRNREMKSNIYFTQQITQNLENGSASLEERRKSMYPPRNKKSAFIDWETSSMHLNDLEERLQNFMSTFKTNGRNQTKLSINSDIQRLSKNKTSLSIDADLQRLSRFKYNDLPEECRFIVKYKKTNIENDDEIESRNNERKDEDTTRENGKKSAENRIRQYTELEYFKLKEEMKVKEKRLSIFRLKHAL